MHKFCAIAPICLLLTGCFGPAENLHVAPVSTSAVLAVNVTDSVPKKATVLGPVSGTSCKNKMWDADPTNDGALDQLRERVAAMGGNGVAGVSYSDGGTSLDTNCWASITATGTAYDTGNEKRDVKKEAASAPGF